MFRWLNVICNERRITIDCLISRKKFKSEFFSSAVSSFDCACIFAKCKTSVALLLDESLMPNVLRISASVFDAKSSLIIWVDASKLSELSAHLNVEKSKPSLNASWYSRFIDDWIASCSKLPLQITSVQLIFLIHSLKKLD